MYSLTRTGDLCSVSCTITTRHATGIRRALDIQLAYRLQRFRQKHLSPRYSVRVRQIRSQIVAIFQTQFAFEVFSTKKATLWAYVTKNEQCLYQLRYRLLERKPNGTRSTESALPVFATTHFFERLLQQSDGDAVSLAKELFNSLIASREILKAQPPSAVSDAGTSISIASSCGLFFGEITSERQLLLKTYISESRLIEKRALWNSLRERGTKTPEKTAYVSSIWKQAA
jgi:hypothetical protein